MKIKILTSSLLLGLSLLCSAQIVKHERLLSFEDKVPPFANSKKSQLSISSDHYKDGEQSLLWSFSPLGELSIKKDLEFEPKDLTGKDTYLSTFVVWVYNENPIDDVVRFEFLKDGRKCSSFPFNINYKGWRAAWVCFERDMEGVPEVGMNEVRIVAPNAQGRLYIDHIITAVKSDHRYQSPDLQAPFVNKKTEHNWLHILRYSEKTPDIAAEPVTAKQKEEIQQIEKRFIEITYTPSGFSAADMNAIKKSFAAYNIRYQNGQVIGLPIFYTRSVEAYERLIPNWQDVFSPHGMDLGQYFTLMNRIAVAYNNAQSTTDKTELKDMFLKMYDHIVDQGVDYGSCLGNITHFGYSFRNYFTACFLMKDVFAEAGYLPDVVRMMVWYAMTKEVFVKPQVDGMDMDAFNTLTNGKVTSMLLMEDSPEKVQYLKSFSRWINNGCLPAKGLEDAFKTDGSAYHHCNLYPAYAVGGFTGATNMIYLLSRTSFAVSELGHSTVKNALQTMRFYCNKTHFPLALSGRHPNGKGELIPAHYATMAIAGAPDGSSQMDAEMAATFLRLKSGGEDDSPKPEYMPAKNKNEQRLYDLFIGKGLKAEKNPTGNIALPYGCTSVQRRDNWSAIVRGHSRYLWAAEHYRGANLYGRYLAHGSMQILTAPVNKEVTPATSGWVEDGFDWGRIPGATAIHLPVEQLKANVLNVDIHSGFEEMLYSDEAFAGGISQNKTNGAFGMKLHEHDKYNGSLRARKSYHFFDGVIVCLGSDIENMNSDYNTETTVFQLAATDDGSTEYWNRYNQNKETWIDHLGIGYYIPDGAENNLVFEKNFPQKSRKQNTGEETSGNWVSLVIDHGKSPKAKSYEYVVMPKSSSEKINLFAKKPTYKVLQKDRNAHIVKDVLSNTTSYVLFETPDLLPKGIIQEVDTTCMIVVKEDKKELLLTVCNPDLAFYRGDSDEKWDENGKRTERSIYSRPWIGNESGEIPVTVTLNGKWNITHAQENCKLVSSDKNKTVLLFTCKDGASFDVRLKLN